MTTDTEQTDKQVRRIILLEGGANLLVLVSKTIVGLTTGSMGILADAIHSLSDLANNIIAWIVMHYSSQPADRKHPYGHRKFETLAVFALAALLVVLAFEIAVSAIRKEQTAVVSSDIELTVMLCVLVINIVVTRWQHGWARRLDSDLLRADATHTFADVLVTATVIAGWQLSAMGYAWVDRLCALGVAVIVIYLAFNLFRRTLPVLVDEYAIDPQEVKQLLNTVDGVINVHRVRSRWIGKTRAVDLVITVEPTLTTEASHTIADAAEALIAQHFDANDISIHVEPETD
jgi:cation diffusion facilitator family transporter